MFSEKRSALFEEGVGAVDERGERALLGDNSPMSAVAWRRDRWREASADEKKEPSPIYELGKKLMRTRHLSAGLNNVCS